MHLFLGAVGFKGVDSDSQEENLIKNTVREYVEAGRVITDEKHNCAVIKAPFGDGFGLIIKGSMTKGKRFKAEYSYPYLDSDCVCSCDEITFERHADKDSYAVICDEVKVGVSLIFYLENISDYYRYIYSKNNTIADRTISLSAFSREGKIILPVLKSDRQIKKCQKDTLVRNRLITAARQGDEEAIENLTLDEMDIYNRITDRLRNEDIYSIIDTLFMPCGVECDQYSVIGEIMELISTKNTLTNEEMWIMVLDCNEVVCRVIINKADLQGEPQVGRRFKGNLWMCAHVNFE